MYLDNAATTKPYDEVINGMGKVAEWYYNPSAIYKEADEVRCVVEGCRKNIEWLLGGGHVYFTSGATESNNWVLRTIGVGENGVSSSSGIVSDNIEHHSVLRVCEELGAVIVRVESDGVVDVEKIVDAVTDETRLVSVMAVNNVLGTRNDIKEIARRVREKNSRVLVHTDATQLIGHEWVNAMDLGVDFLSASAHKFGGLKGTGLLWSKEEIKDGMLTGGSQEYGVRAGTENVVGIWAMSRALSISLRTCETDMQACKKMWERLRRGFEEIDGCVICGSTKKRMFNNIYVAFKDISSEALVMALDDMGIMCSVGSACDSGELDKNYVLEAIGMDDEHIDGGVRLTYRGMFDDEEFFRCLKKCLTLFGYYE